MDLPQQRERVTVDGLGNIGQGKWKKSVDKEEKSGIMKSKAVSRYINSSEQLYRNASKVKPIEDYEDFVIHGDRFSFELHDSDGNSIDEYSPLEFANILKQDPNYNGGKVRFISCETGADDMGAAQMLSTYLGVEVLAPTDIVWITFDGDLIVEPTEFENTGTWRSFYPKGE